MNFRALKPKAGTADAENISTVLGVMKVAKVRMRKSSSGEKLDKPALALCDGTVEGGVSSVVESGFDSLESSLAAMRALAMDVEAQT